MNAPHEDMRMQTVFRILDQECSSMACDKPATIDELKIRVDMLARYLREFEDDYYHTEDQRFGLAYEQLYERYVQLRDFYAGAKTFLSR